MPSDWERVAGDPELLADVRRRFTGTGDPLDHLRWIERPGEASGSGAEDPATRLERDRQALYRPGGTGIDTERLRRDERAVEADRLAARRALQEADAARSSSPTPSDGRVRSTAGPARRTVAGLAVAALVVGGVAGFAAARLGGTPHPAALAVFDRAQHDDDRPPASAPLPASAVRSSLRHIGTSSTTGTALYAARARGGDVCIVAVVQALRYVEACTTDSAFAASGLSMAFEAAVDPIDDSGLSRDQEVVPTWAPDGSVRF